MNHSVQTDDRPTRAASPASAGARPGRTARKFPLTDLSVWLMVTLIAVGLPRTVLADLDIVRPESSLLYYILALAPFAVWLVVAVFHDARKPFMNFVVVGVLYGLSLVVIHQALWNAGASLGHNPPVAAVNFADSVDPAYQQLALRGYTVMIAMAIGVGTGLVAGLVAMTARARRSRR
ncbi:hypothetical protein AB0L70_35165 [Kribbella sp. NPDC051952]|uniref:hypothetical protein n=1 Tax=Kribbella sp. NPDC051952 TaxID=3154851 RepID=UPI00341382E7